MLRANSTGEAADWRRAIEMQIEMMQGTVTTRLEGRLLKHWKGTHSHHRQYFVLDRQGLHYDDEPEMTCHHSLKGFVDLQSARLAGCTEEDAQDEIAEQAASMDAAWKKTIKGAMGGKSTRKWKDAFKKSMAEKKQVTLRQILLDVPADGDDYEDERTLVLTADTISEAAEWRNSLKEMIQILQGNDDVDDEIHDVPLMPRISM